MLYPKIMIQDTHTGLISHHSSDMNHMNHPDCTWLCELSSQKNDSASLGETRPFLICAWSKGATWAGSAIFKSLSKMHLYALTLQKASTITTAIHGNFSGKKVQEIAVARGKILEILRPDPTTGKVVSLLTTEAFGLIRSLISFRLTGSTKGKSHVMITWLC